MTLSGQIHYSINSIMHFLMTVEGDAFLPHPDPLPHWGRGIKQELRKASSPPGGGEGWSEGVDYHIHETKNQGTTPNVMLTW
jgi:hypothetical protein